MKLAPQATRQSTVHLPSYSSYFSGLIYFFTGGDTLDLYYIATEILACSGNLHKDNLTKHYRIKSSKIQAKQQL